jgi:putative transposase
LQRQFDSAQYTSIAFGKRCHEAGVRPSMGSVGDAYDNAMCESFFATLECELIDRRRFRTKAEARLAIFSFIEGFYNPRRRHSGLGYLSPIDYERHFEQQAADPGTGQPAVLLTAVKARPRNHIGSHSLDDPAGLDRLSAGRPEHPAGRDGRTATAEQKNTTTHQEDNVTPTTLP